MDPEELEILLSKQVTGRSRRFARGTVRQIHGQGRNGVKLRRNKGGKDTVENLGGLFVLVFATKAVIWEISIPVSSLWSNRLKLKKSMQKFLD